MKTKKKRCRHLRIQRRAFTLDQLPEIRGYQEQTLLAQFPKWGPDHSILQQPNIVLHGLDIALRLLEAHTWRRANVSSGRASDLRSIRAESSLLCGARGRAGEGTTS